MEQKVPLHLLNELLSKEVDIYRIPFRDSLLSSTKNIFNRKLLKKSLMAFNAINTIKTANVSEGAKWRIKGVPDTKLHIPGDI